MKTIRWAIALLLFLATSLLLMAYVIYRVWLGVPGNGYFTETREWTEYQPPVVADDLTLVDDDLESRQPSFDPERIHPILLDGAQINLSAAVLRLDVPIIKPDVEPQLLKLRPNYRTAILEAKEAGFQVLPSANLVDGIGKQVDDGLMAAIETAVFRGQSGSLPGAISLVSKLAAEAQPQDIDRPYLLAVLELAGEDNSTQNAATRQAIQTWLTEFKKAPLAEPAGFYTWNEELGRIWRSFRALQFSLSGPHEAVARGLAERLSNPAHRTEYEAIFSFYSSLSNPARGLAISELIGRESQPLPEILGELKRSNEVTFLPISTSRETELFDRAFPLGPPAGTSLMKELIRAIRSGEIDFEPREKDGWYQYQIHALQSMLVTDANDEREKLQLTASYKRRLTEAFQALVTKRRETHLRTLGPLKAAAALPIRDRFVSPSLRVEPMATYYLRTARAYQFVANLLEASLGTDALQQLHGLSASGERPESLAQELERMIHRFYGLHLIVCEDLGMEHRIRPDENVDLTKAMEVAVQWLDNLQDDPDLAVDTRVVVPISVDPFANKMRLWGTLGVRLAKLDASFVRPPSLRLDASQPWEAPKLGKLKTTHYVIAVDEFVEFELAGVQLPSREVYRGWCDASPTKEAFLQDRPGQ